MIVRKLIPILVTASLLLAACTASPAEDTGKLQVVATTSIVADVVSQVGGEYVMVTTLLPLGADPHTFEPRPQDAAAIANAGLVFANGAGLEEFLHNLLENAGAEEKLVEVSEGIELLQMVEENHQESEDHEHEGKEHHHEGGDPHTWMDPNNVITWTDKIAQALAQADPQHAAVYQANAAAYAASLRELDNWVRSKVAQVPPEKRLLVTDHGVFSYFAAAYGFEQVGTITGSFSTNAAPSAKELAALEDEIKSLGVKAIFVGENANQSLADQVAADTGIRVVPLYHASLTGPDGPAPDYLAFMRYNVNAIVETLK